MTTNYHTSVVEQIIDVIEKIAPTDYAQKLEILNDNSLGQHFRHILEFYLCLLEGSNSGIVNYDNRKRDLHIEQDKPYAVLVARTILDKLHSLHLNQPVGLETCLGSSTDIIPSSFARELVYLSEHTIHHFALIKIGVSSCFPKVSLCENFGVAESTINYKKQEN